MIWRRGCRGDAQRDCELARFARGLQDDLHRDQSRAHPEVEQRGHGRPHPSPETGEAPGLWAGWLHALTAARLAGRLEMEIAALFTHGEGRGAMPSRSLLVA